MNALIRTVKRRQTAKKIMAVSSVTVFEKTTYGYRQDKTVSSNIIADRVFEVFDGVFYNYQSPLKENQKVIRL